MSKIIVAAISSAESSLRIDRCSGDGSWGPPGQSLYRITATSLATEALGASDTASEQFLNAALSSAPPMTRLLAWAIRSPATSKSTTSLVQSLLRLETPTGGWPHASRDYAESRGRTDMASPAILPTFLACRALQPMSAQPDIHRAIERAADWVHSQIAFSNNLEIGNTKSYMASATAFALCILRWGQTHRVPEDGLARLAEKLRLWVTDGEYGEDRVADAGRELDTPYALFAPVWVCLALLEDCRQENHEAILRLGRHLLALQRPDGSFARTPGGGERDVYTNAQALLLLRRIDSYLKSDLSRDSSLLRHTASRRTGSERALSVDVAVVCAVDREIDRLRTVSQNVSWERLPTTDTNDFYIGKLFTAKGRMLRIVVAKAGRMGMTSAAALTAKMILRFSPELVCAIGIAAGTRAKDRGYGDVLVASPAFDYTSGKWKEKGKGDSRRLYLEPDPQPVDIPELLRNRIDGCKTKYLEEIRQAWKGGQLPNTPLRVHLGPMGSGNAVVAAAPVVASIQRLWRKLVGIEMETYGVYRAAHDTVSPPPLFVAIKSVCDYADSRKGDDWQDWAAHTSAMFLMLLLKNEMDDILPE